MCRKTQVFWHQSEARTAATVWNWSGNTLSPGALLAFLYFSFVPYFPTRLDFPSPPLSAPGSPRMVIGVYSSQKNKSKHGMVNIYCCTNFTASNNYIHKVIAVTCIVRINAAVISSSSSSNPISPELFACSKWAIPENIRTIPRTASIFSSPYFHPPLPSELPRCVKPPTVWIFHIFVKFSDLQAGFEDIHCPIWLILRQNI